MKTIMIEARRGSVLDEVRVIAKYENVDPVKLARRLGEGRVIIPRNTRRNGRVRIIGIGEGLTTKVNVNIGTSGTLIDIKMEKEKARIAVKYGSDTIMDLSTGGNISEIRRILMRESKTITLRYSANVSSMD